MSQPKEEMVSVRQLKYTCELVCEQRAIDINDIYMLMPGLYFCFKKKDQHHIVPSDLMAQIAANEAPVFQLINKYLKVMLEMYKRRKKEKAEEQNSSS